MHKTWDWRDGDWKYTVKTSWLHVLAVIKALSNLL